MLDYVSINNIHNGEVLKIDNRRLLKHLWVFGGFFGGGMILSFLLFEILSSFHYGIAAYIAPASILLISLVLAVLKIIRIPYHRLCLFDKKQKIYRIIEMSLLKNDEVAGKLDDIKAIEITVTAYHNEDSVSYSYQAFLIMNDFLVYDGSNMVAVEEETGTESNSTRVATAIANFLQLPVPEVEHP